MCICVGCGAEELVRPAVWNTIVIEISPEIENDSPRVVRIDFCLQCQAITYRMLEALGIPLEARETVE